MIFGGIGIIVLLGLIIAVGSSRAVVISGPGAQGVVVKGESKITAKPDLARVTLGVETQGPSAGEAQQKNAESMTRLIAVLKGMGLAGKDIQTTGLSLNPMRKYIKELNREQIIGYRAVNQVTVSISDLTKVSEALDQSVKAGANNIEQIVFLVESPEKLRDQALAMAVKDARVKAEVMAKAAGKRITGTIAISEANLDLQPYQADSYKIEAQMAAAAANTPVEPGVVKVIANVQVNYKI